MFIEVVDMAPQKKQNLKFVSNWEELKILTDYINDNLTIDLGQGAFELEAVQFDSFGMNFFGIFDGWMDEYGDLSKYILKAPDKYNCDYWWFLDSHNMSNEEWLRFINGVVIRWNLAIEEKAFIHTKEPKYIGELKKIKPIFEESTKVTNFGYGPIIIPITYLEELFNVNASFI